MTIAYCLGLASGGMIPLSGSPVGFIPDPYPVEPLPYTELIGQDNENRPIYAGDPTLVWRWKYMKIEWWNWIYSFLESKNSNTVYLTMRDDINAATYQLNVCTAIMWRPTGKMIAGPLWSDVELKFTKVEAFP